MKISSRFSVAIHIIALLAIKRDKVYTSEAMAKSVNNNPVVIRRIIGMLKNAGLVDVTPGCGGAHLLKPVDDITLFDIYRAVDVVEEGKLFQIHENTNHACVIGGNIQETLTELLPQAQLAMEEVLKTYNMKDVITKILEKD